MIGDDLRVPLEALEGWEDWVSTQEVLEWHAMDCRMYSHNRTGRVVRLVAHAMRIRKRLHDMGAMVNA